MLGVIHRHHFLPASIEEFASLGIPHRLAAALGRYLPFPSGAGVGPDVNFRTAGLVRSVGDPAAVRRRARRRGAGLTGIAWLRFAVLSWPDVKFPAWLGF